MSGFEIEEIEKVARGMDDEQMRVFLSVVNRKLMEEELSRRADENEKLLSDIASRMIPNV